MSHSKPRDVDRCVRPRVDAPLTAVRPSLPLQVEILYNEYPFAAAFAVASLLALLGLVTLALKSAVEWKVKRDYEAAAASE